MDSEKIKRRQLSYEERLIEALSKLDVCGGQPVAIDLVAQGLALVSGGDRGEDDMAHVGQAIISVAQSLDIPVREVRRYLQAAADGEEWNPEKVQILLNQIQ